MIKEIELKIKPQNIEDTAFIEQQAVAIAKVAQQSVQHVLLVKKSLDARGFRPFFRLRLQLFIDEPYQPEPALLDTFQHVADRKSVLVVGAGPAGYFAALELIEQGLKPIIFDRGKEVQARRRDLRAIQQFGKVNPHSNYCFGEGGAGTYSDGKLYTRSHKRGKIAKVLKLLVEHGAKSDILTDAHPHIGSNKLPKIVANIRETILQYGGEIHFDSWVTDILIENNRVIGVTVNEEKEFWGDHLILATGHSARDIYKLLHKKQVTIEFKPFALGVRIEHPQSLIDQIQYNQPQREENLPASSYKLTCQVDDAGVYSFCMCPGGLVVPAATAPGEIVVNGMSMSRRDSAFANSGTVTSIEWKHIPDFHQHGVFAAMAFQQHVEQTLFDYHDGSQQAPAQRLTDFVAGKISQNLPDSSYIPGLYSAPLHELLPDFVYERLREAVQVFGRKMKGYFTENANVIGTESRTSAPVKIPREKNSLQHPQIKGLFPCGEGAGYAGGILSAAMDGQNVAKAIARQIDEK